MHKISVTVDEACDLASIGRTTLYKFVQKWRADKTQSWWTYYHPS